MKSFIILLFFYSFTFTIAKAATGISPWTPDSARKELVFLLEERKKLFDEYSESLSKKSGFFGNQTKNDLRDSRLKLEAIVAEDNKIMSALNRTLDFRNFEKQNMKYDVSTNEDRIRSLQVMNDTLNAQLIRLERENKINISKVRSNRIYFVLLFLILGVMMVFVLRKVKTTPPA